MDLSIIIVNWNTKEFLLPCVRSVFEDGQRMGWEVIVVDNGSRDGSADEIRKTFPFIHLVENEKNLGFAKAVNQGLQKASGRYVLLLNPDTQVKDGAIVNVSVIYGLPPRDRGGGGTALKFRWV